MSQKLINELHKQIRFLRKLVDKRDEELKALKEEKEILAQVIKEQPVDVQFIRYDPGRYSAHYQIVDREAAVFTKKKGSFWHWQELYEFIKWKYKEMDWNPETVRRRCQLAVKEGLLERVKPGTYIYFGGRKIAHG